MSMDKNSSDPFLDDDIDDSDFLSHPRQGNSGYLLGNDTSEKDEWEAKRMQLLEKRRIIEERTLQSSNTSLGLVYETEQVGVLTAEELVRQREQLENIEGNLDFINNTMRTSQKHINSLKSIFGGIKNYFSKNGEGSDPAVKPPVDKPTSKAQAAAKLQDTIDSLKSDTKFKEGTHPALRIRDLPYDDDDDESGFGRDVSKDRSHPPPMSSSFSSDIDDKLNINLENMSLGLGRLKNLAVGLNEEIEFQNEKIDLIHNKTDRADETLEHQNRQIKRILKK